MKVTYWTIIYSHRHGTDVWPIFAHQCADPERGPTEDEVIAGLDDLYEPDREDEWIEISGRQVIEIPGNNDHATALALLHDFVAANEDPDQLGELQANTQRFLDNQKVQRDQGVDFWRKTALTLYDHAPQDVIDEHLSQKQIDAMDNISDMEES